MPLTDTAVRQAKPTGKNYTLKDSAGLALFVGAKGAKQWHLRFYWLGKQAWISMGVYPAVSVPALAAASSRATRICAYETSSDIGTSQKRLQQRFPDGSRADRSGRWWTYPLGIT